MQLKSLGHLTNLFFAKTNGTIKSASSSLIIKTPSNKNFHWGNYMLFDNPPKSGDLELWCKLFDEEFDYYQSPHHYAFSWDTHDEEFSQETKDELLRFQDANFDLESTVALCTNQLVPPPFFNEKIKIKKILTDDEWKEVIELQILTRDERFELDSYKVFKTEQFANYKKMWKENLGFWFGAYLDDKLVGDLGIFYNEQIGRYQSVSTHPDYRRQGICGTLVYSAGQLIKNECNLSTLVMEADENYHAARIYESVGFKTNCKTMQLSWWKNKPNNTKETV